MAYDVTMVKLVTGETVIGKADAATGGLKDPAVLQTIPTQQGVQMMLMPYGYPFDADFCGTIDGKHVLYTYKSCPADLQTKYMEACSNLTLSSGGLGGLDLKGESAAAGASSLLLK
ncbi:hypothetical protein [Desulfovibrio cuneatus]|uniref:hypothetical protein n=1 Tax=Desulfovibrio cuneatus TaxID=159728 RepID=UPI000402ECD9|nr:hypothetical protein [Desulfovibrio cuneatus]